jgi:hypothetical protein
VYTAGGKLYNPVPGGTITISTAKDIGEQKEANLTFRVRCRAKCGAGATLHLRSQSKVERGRVSNRPLPGWMPGLGTLHDLPRHRRLMGTVTMNRASFHWTTPA